MPNDLAGEIGFLSAKLDSALIGARVAEQAAIDAAAALERIQQQIKRQQVPPPLPIVALHVRPWPAGSQSRTHFLKQFQFLAEAQARAGAMAGEELDRAKPHAVGRGSERGRRRCGWRGRGPFAGGPRNWCELPE